MPTSHVDVIHGRDTGTAHINVADNGDNQIVIIPGANDMLTAADVERAQDVLEQTRVNSTQLSCSTQPGPKQLWSPIEHNKIPFFFVSHARYWFVNWRRQWRPR